MNPSTHIDKVENRKQGLTRRLPQVLFCMTIFSAIMLSIGLLNGCSKAPKGGGTTESTSAKVNPWELTGKKLKKETDFAACQNALRVLVENLRNDDSYPKPASLGPDEERALAIVPLGPGDKDEIHGWIYSAHDPVYLADCFYLRDVAQSLKLPNLTPEQIADIGFAWVCRSVALDPWYLPWSVGERRGLMAAAVPPTFVLRRGCGSALERMYVFLALLQQMDFEGCLIGPPDARKIENYDAIGSDRMTPLPGGPPRPFWAVGVRIGSDIKLYDPWRGEAFPAQLSTLKANPEAHNNWFESAANLSGTKSDDVKIAKVYLAVPVNALSPRMEMLNQKLAKEGVAVRLAINPTQYLAAFPDPKPTFWNTPEDRFTYGRVSRMFLPREQGGADDAPFPDRLYDQFQQYQLPSGFNSAVPELRALDAPEVAKDIRDQNYFKTRQIFSIAFLGAPSPREQNTMVAIVASPNPRERIQRGFFQDALRDLIEKQDIFVRVMETVRNTPDVEEQIRHWGLSAKELSLNLGRTAIIADKAEKSNELSAIRAAYDAHMRDPTTLLMLNRVYAPICKLETAFLLSLCKHEEAERTQTQADYATGEELVGIRQRAQEAWITARSAWRTYFEGFNGSQESLPGRAVQAKTLSARAEKFANAK
jgi:hypothetical protein